MLMLHGPVVIILNWIQTLSKNPCSSNYIQWTHFETFKTFLLSLNALNVYQIDLYQHFDFSKQISVWKSSLWVLLNIRFGMKKKKCNPTHYFYQ